MRRRDRRERATGNRHSLRLGSSLCQGHALSIVLVYVLLTLGSLAGLAVLGLDLTKLTIMAGAFGVGITFGLQSVVNNFVSGLILLFERPIHVGDTIEAGGITGSVRRIGIRASVMRTFQGAEIIVPNSQLVTERVINWTLSDRQRLIELPVGAAVYDAGRAAGISCPFPQREVRLLQDPRGGKELAPP
jgi:potassium efflux system protein